MKIKNWFLDVLKGGSLGLGMIPGVSAGTMALIVGIYDRLIGGIANLRKEFKKSLISLIPIGIGAVMSAIICMLGVNYGLDYAPFAIISLFAGLIIGSLPVITKEIKGVKITFKLYTKKICDHLKRRESLHDISAADCLDITLVCIILVHDIADDLLQNVFHGHQSAGLSVFINNNRHVDLT